MALRKAEPLEENQHAWSDGAREIESKIELSNVRDAFVHLSLEQREVMHIVCVEGYSYHEASEILGVPIGTVMSRLSRARVGLMTVLDAPRANEGNVMSFHPRSVSDANSSR
jgi:DNA-directed RNA polymerase specialized sigma24 family protein